MPKLKTKGLIHDTLTGFDYRVDPPLRPRKAMHAKCLECQCGSRKAVKHCSITDCTLWPYRLGKGICTSESGDLQKVPLSLQRKRALEANIAQARNTEGADRESEE